MSGPRHVTAAHLMENMVASKPVTLLESDMALEVKMLPDAEGQTGERAERDMARNDGRTGGLQQ